MAGIGFELRRMIDQRKGFLAKVRAYACAGLISSGPWLMTILTLTLLTVAGPAFRGEGDIRLFRALVTYAFAFSLVLVGAGQMSITRRIADLLYSKRYEHVLPAFAASFLVVAVILLNTSVTLGLVVLIGVPVLLLLIGPLLKPLQRRNMTQREMMGQLSNLATDIVSGLRILRGIGGEKVFHDRYVHESQKVRRAGVQVGRLQSVLDALQVLLPGIFVVVVVWIGARFAVQGRISPGELVAFYGYAAFLMIPLRTATEFANKWIRAFVAARRVVRVLALEPEVVEPDQAYDEPAPTADLVDVESGVRVEHGILTALVSEDPEETALVADRLGHYAPGEVRWGDVPLAGLPRSVVRRRIVVSDTASTLFSGPLREALDPRTRR